MHLLTVTRSIPAPVGDVFAVLSAVDVLADWATSVESVELLDPLPIREGTRFRETRRHNDRSQTVEMTITRLVPRELIEVSASQGRLETVSRWHLEPDDVGTLVRFDMAMRGPGLVMKTVILGLSFLMRGIMRRCIEDDLDDLTRFLEAPANDPTVAYEASDDA